MKTTKKHFELFKKEGRKWLREFGLLDWETFFNHKDIDARARYSADIEHRIAVLILSTQWEGPQPQNKLIRRAAFHEVAELLLAKIRCLAESRTCDEQELNEAIHAVIRTLENVIFEKR